MPSLELSVAIHWAHSHPDALFQNARGFNESTWGLLLHVASRFAQVCSQKRILYTGFSSGNNPSFQWFDDVPAGSVPLADNRLDALLEFLSASFALPKSQEQSAATILAVFVGDKEITLSGSFLDAKTHIIAFVDSPDDPQAIRSLHSLAHLAGTSSGSLNVIQLQDDGYTEAERVLGHVARLLPQPYYVGLCLGHIRVPVELVPNPMLDGWLEVATRHKLPAEIPRNLSLTGFVEISNLANPVVLKRYELAPTLPTQPTPALLAMLPEALRTKHRAAVVSLTDSWMALVVPGLNSATLRLLVLAPTPENVAFMELAQGRAPSQAAHASDPLKLFTHEFFPEMLTPEFEQLFEHVKLLPASAAQLFYVADVIRARALQFGGSGLLEALAAIVEDERKKVEMTNPDAAYVLEELQHLIHFQPTQPFVFSGIEVPEPKQPPARMSLDFIC